MVYSTTRQTWSDETAIIRPESISEKGPAPGPVAWSAMEADDVMCASTYLDGLHERGDLIAADLTDGQDGNRTFLWTPGP
jgi:hypothetical protein